MPTTMQFTSMTLTAHPISSTGLPLSYMELRL